MSTKKFLLLTLKMHVEVTQVQLEPTSKMKIDFNSQAFCHSAPQLVTQLAMIWSGVSLFFPTNGFNTKSKTNINNNKQ